MLAEQQTKWIVNNNLVNKGWHIDGDQTLKNVYLQEPPHPEQQRKLKGEKPDYILYQTGTYRPIAIIEAKKYMSVVTVPTLFAIFRLHTT